ncbi:MAG: hypothetical protein J6X33_01665 [Clostridiales bacterium]|nr:hypothetical protein [Clostridiales bacterium]
MDDRKNIFDYIGQLFTRYGVMVVIFIVLSLIMGEHAKNLSTLFALGSSGLSLATLGQLFLLTVILVLLQVIFLSDVIIKDMSLILRNVFFFLSVMAVSTVFVILFAWFPVTEPSAWIGFIVSFVVCTFLSAFITRLKERAENKKMEEALNRLKK